MRTKTLLLSAILGLAGAASATAQTNVFSVNAVGYVNVGFPTGFSIRGNPLKGSPDNSLGNIFDTNSVPLGTTIYQYKPGQPFGIYTFEEQDNGSVSWGDANSVQFAPGEGFFVRATSSFTNTFVGDVPQGADSNTDVRLGFSLKSSVVPQSGRLDTVLGFPAQVGDVVYILKADGKNYDICTYGENDDGSFGWDVVPAPKVGEGFWVSSAAAKPWNRNFSVNQ